MYNFFHCLNTCIKMFRKEVSTGTVKKTALIAECPSMDLVNVRFQIVAPRVESNHFVAVVGSNPSLGSWDVLSNVR
jgi:hypothetical protein